MRHIGADLRYAWRTLRLNPGFTAAAIIAIAVGIGINSGIFSVFNGLLLRDMPAPRSAELVTVHQLIENASKRSVNGARSMFATSEYTRYRDGTKTLDGLVAYTLPTDVTLSGISPQEIAGALVS